MVNLFRRHHRANGPRTYIDLIFQASNQYATWDPKDSIKVGDLGVILRETGKFDKLGNIYDDKFNDLRQYFEIEAPKQRRAVIGPSVIGSFNTTTKIESGKEDDSFKVEAKFAKEKGAVLVMKDSVKTSIDCSRSVKNVLQKGIIKEKRLAIVTEITQCSQYAYIVGGKDQREAKIELCVMASSPTTTRSNVSAPPRYGWSQQTISGPWHASNTTWTGDQTFTTLMELRMLNPRSDDPAIDFRAPPPGVSLELPEYYPPWSELDSEGEEIEEEGEAEDE